MLIYCPQKDLWTALTTTISMSILLDLSPGAALLNVGHKRVVILLPVFISTCLFCSPLRSQLYPLTISSERVVTIKGIWALWQGYLFQSLSFMWHHGLLSFAPGKWKTTHWNYIVVAPLTNTGQDIHYIFWNIKIQKQKICITDCLTLVVLGLQLGLFVGHGWS